MAIGTAYIKIMPEAKGISNEIAGITDPASESAGKSGGSKWSSAFKKVLVAAGIGAAVGKALFAGADLQQSIGGIETLYKDASDKMMEYASQAYRTAGIDSTTYMEQATSFSAALIKSYNGDVDKAADAANQAMIDMADNSAKMGKPLQDIQAAYQSFARGQYQLLDNLSLGYGGTKSEMERLLADAEKITGVHYDINELGDVYDAIHVIQDELGITGTTAEEAASTISGSIGMLKASWQDFLGNLTLGNDIYPQMEALVESIIAVAKNVIPAVWNIISGIPKMIIGHWGEIVGAVQDTITNAISYVTSSAPQWVTAITTLVRNAVAYFMQMFPVWRDAIISTLTNVASTLMQNAPMIIEKVRGIVANALTLLAHYAPQIIQAVFTIIKNLGTTLITNLPSILRSVFNLAMTVIKGGLTLAWNAVKSAVSGIVSTVATLGGSVVSKIRSGLSSVWEVITSPFRKAKETLDGVIAKIKGLFPLKLGKIFDGIKLPHFKIKGGKIPWGIGGAGEAPSVSVEWYAQGGIMTKPTLFGGGEAGAEAIMPLDPFWAKLDRMADGIYQMADGQGMTVNVYGTAGMDVNELADAVEQRIIEMQNRRRLAWQ